jgi:hypothetical protein
MTVRVPVLVRAFNLSKDHVTLAVYYQLELVLVRDFLFLGQ